MAMKSVDSADKGSTISEAELEVRRGGESP